MTTIYKVNCIINNFETNIISETEAEEYGVNVKNAEIASIKDLNNEINNENDGYIGEIEVKEGIYEFNFDTKEYIKIR